MHRLHFSRGELGPIDYEAAPVACADVSEIEEGHTNVDLAIVTTAETIVVTSDPITISPGAKRVLLVGYVQITTGAGTTALVPRVRRGPALADALVGEANPQAAAASVNDRLMVLVVDDNPGEGKRQYSLTVVQTAASGNGNVTAAALVAIAL